MVDTTIFGANGELGSAIVKDCTERGLTFKSYSRNGGTLTSPISEFDANLRSRSYIFSLGSFRRKRFIECNQNEIALELESNLTLPMSLTHKILTSNNFDDQVNFIFIGSTSSYNGFELTAPYCAAKFGLRGFVLSMNDEYKNTGTRFSLVSMGTMKSKMGAELSHQDSSTFLPLHIVSKKVLDNALCFDESFEPEVIIRRRVVR
jgi:short-subunit dehydrogenase